MVCPMWLIYICVVIIDGHTQMNEHEKQATERHRKS